MIPSCLPGWLSPFWTASLMQARRPDAPRTDLPRQFGTRATARTCEAFWQAVEQVRKLFTNEKCYNSYKGACYEANQTQRVLTGPATALRITAGPHPSVLLGFAEQAAQW